ncbi:hypothetical protein STVA_34930 [Allostella vacuolata]|nr:hypothetical protein STVA_34930 [Stella vacuolata]
MTATDRTQSAPPALPEQVVRYVDRSQRSVDGWLSPLDARLVALVSAAQAGWGITGTLGEIGVHHGRLLILMALGLQPGERAFAVDIFGEQELNVDRSGEGDEGKFRANLARFGIPADRVAILQASSLEIRWPDIERQAGARSRLFSIDGGHTAHITANDLAIADAGLLEDGVAVLDDYFNPEFPEVSQGMCQHRLVDGGRLVPFAIGDNKLLLTRPGQGERYRAMLERSVPSRFLVRPTEMFGQPVIVFRTPRRLVHRIRQSELARRLRDHPIGRALKPLIRRLVRE